jgi:hypothetical protein
MQNFKSEICGAVFVTHVEPEKSYFQSLVTKPSELEQHFGVTGKPRDICGRNLLDYGMGVGFVFCVLY